MTDVDQDLHDRDGVEDVVGEDLHLNVQFDFFERAEFFDHEQMRVVRRIAFQFEVSECRLRVVRERIVGVDQAKFEFSVLIHHQLTVAYAKDLAGRAETS